MYAATSWGYRHPYFSTSVRIMAGILNLALGILFLSHGNPWGWLQVAVSVPIFVAAYFLARGKFGSRGNGLS